MLGSHHGLVHSSAGFVYSDLFGECVNLGREFLIRKMGEIGLLFHTNRALRSKAGAVENGHDHRCSDLVFSGEYQLFCDIERGILQCQHPSPR